MAGLNFSLQLRREKKRGADSPQGTDRQPQTTSSSDDEEDVRNHPQDVASPRDTTDRGILATGKAMKERIDRIRRVCGAFVNDVRVQLFIISLIGINAVMMGIGTFDFVTENQRVSDIFELVDKIFLIIFTIELGLQLIFHGLRLFLDGWLVFDLIIIVLSWSFQEVQIIRSFRIFRALRLVTRIKVLKNLVMAMLGVMPRMVAIFLMLALIFYVFAVMFTQLFGDLYEDGQTMTNFFGRIDHTFFTLFQVMTLDAWADICREVQETYSWAWLPFIAFVVISGFIVVNLIIAVVCDALSMLDHDEKAKIHGMYEEGQHHSETMETTEIVDVAEQLNELERRVEELSRMQDQTLQSLQCLTHYLQSVPPERLAKASGKKDTWLGRR